MRVPEQVTFRGESGFQTLTISKMAVYLRCKIIEAWNEKGQVYYLFFYKDKFIAGYKARGVKLRSFIAKAFKQGVILTSPHPIIRKIIHDSQTYVIQDFSQLVKKLKKQFSPYEQAFILTFFESFIPKKELFEQIKDIYYRLRRNGQLFCSWQIVRLLHDFAPKNRWARETANLVTYSKYYSLYFDFSEELLAKDKIYGEKLLYDGRNNKDHLILLEHSLLHDGLVMDAAALAIDSFLNDPDAYDYKTLVERLQMVFSEDEVCEIVENMLDHKPDVPLLQNDLLERYLKLGRVHDAAMLIAEHDIPPSVLSKKALNAILELILTDTADLPYEKLQTYLVPLSLYNPEQTEKAIAKCVNYLLREYDMDYVENWLAPIKQVNPTLSIYRKMEAIKKFKNNPDKQLELGKIYYDLHLYELALDCFSWEMELQETNPEPVEWLAKTYKKMGLEEEANSYLLLLENKFFTKSP